MRGDDDEGVEQAHKNDREDGDEREHRLSEGEGFRRVGFHQRVFVARAGHSCARVRGRCVFGDDGRQLLLILCLYGQRVSDSDN